MITADSRYADTKVDKLDTTRGLIFTLVAGQQEDYQIVYTFHQWRAYDRIDVLAYQLYADGTKWWIIADANPEFLDWENIPVGEIIRIPSV